MRAATSMIALVFLAASQAPALAAADVYLEGKFYLDMQKSHWGGGVNGAPASQKSSAGTPNGITGGVWAFEKDDGKHRLGYIMQTLESEKIRVFFYDVDYDDKLHWLNDWYRESNKKIDANTFTASYEVHMAGQPASKSGPVICKIGQDRMQITCDMPGLHEVYDKAAPPYKMP